jgi:molecular chaperone DnaK
VPQIEVTFDIDANGIVNVSAKDLATKKEQKITITASSGLSEEEIERMIREAKEHAESDEKRRALVDARNNADSLAYSTRKALKDLGGKVDEAKKKEIEQALERLEEAAKGEDVEKIKAETEAVTQLLHQLSAQAYQQASGTQAGPGNDGSTVDAEAEDIDGDKKD